MAGQTTTSHGCDEGLSRKHGLCFVPPENVVMDDILLAVGEIIGVKNIRAASRMSHKVVVFVSQTHFADIVVQRGLVLGDDQTFVPVSSMDTAATKIMISNCPPFVSNEILLQKLGEHGTVVSRVITVPLRTRNENLKHIASFRRFCFVVLKDGVTQLSVSFNLKLDGHEYQVFAATETLICYGCGSQGHTRNYCPNAKRTYAAAAGSTSTPHPPLMFGETQQMSHL